MDAPVGEKVGRVQLDAATALPYGRNSRSSV